MRSALRRQLQRAVDDHEFTVYYQPKFHLASGDLQGVEALLRWRTRAGAWIPPSAFTPILERTGMIEEVGSWVFERAAIDSAYWRRNGRSVVRVAVNVSPIQLRQRDFLSSILAISGSCSAQGTGLDIELTESIAMPDSDALIKVLNDLSAANVAVALDDFGTGYSSLSLLVKLPVRQLKIDRSFIRQLGKSRKAVAVVEAIIRLARELGMKTIAEGIETADQRDRLRALGCDIGQGFYFGRAMSREDLLASLQSIRPQA